MSLTHLLEECACVYLGIDLGLPDRDASVAAVRAWLIRSGYEPDRVDQAVESVRRRLDGPEAVVELLRAIDVVRRTAPESRRSEIIEDLIHFALRDHRYQPREARYVESVAALWGVHPEELVPDRLWSVLGGTSDGDWSAVHDLAFLYLRLAHEADAEISLEEKEAITRKLAEWLPAALPRDVLGVVERALQVYAAGATSDRVAACLASVRASVPEHQRKAVLSDLMFVARADAVVLVEEKALIARLAEGWNLPVPGDEA